MTQEIVQRFQRRLGNKAQEKLSRKRDRSLALRSAVVAIRDGNRATVTNNKTLEKARKVRSEKAAARRGTK